MDPAADPAAALAAIVELGYAQQHVTYVEIASLVLLSVEIIHSLPDEVALIWRADWNAGKILFLVSRYLPFTDVLLSLAYTTTTANSIEFCQKSFIAGSALTLIGVVLAEVILYLRVYALSGGARWAAAVLSFLFVALHGTTFVFLIRFILSLGYASSPLPSVIGCLPVKGSPKDLSIVFVLIMASELAILAMTIWILFSKFKQSKNHLISIFYRDGAIYFILLTAISGGNIICNLVAPPGYSYLLASLQRVLHSILATRMVLHLRRVHKRKVDVSKGIPLSDVGPFSVQVNVQVDQSVGFPDREGSSTQSWQDRGHDRKPGPIA